MRAEAPASDRPEVLVVAGTRLADRFASWLAGDRSVETASDAEEALEAMAESIEVVLLDRRLPGRPPAEVRERIRKAGSGCRVVAVTTADPDVDAVAKGFDASIARPVEREDLLATVEAAERRVAYERDIREYYSLVSKKALLESGASDLELETRDEYRAVTERVDELGDRIDDAVSELRSHDDFVGAFRDLRTGR